MAIDDLLVEKQAYYARLEAAVQEDDSDDSHVESDLRCLKRKRSILSQTPKRLRSQATGDENAEPQRAVVAAAQTVNPGENTTTPPSTTRKGRLKANITATKPPAPQTTNPVLVPNRNPHHIFHGLRFYFFPNNDKHPARRMRIAKALSYGATWVREWPSLYTTTATDPNHDDPSNGSLITHIVIDKAITYDLLLKFLRISHVPKDVVIVSEEWPADCIAHLTLLDPRLLMYRVKGYTPPSAAAPTPADENAAVSRKDVASSVAPDANPSPVSLQLKPAPSQGTQSTDARRSHYTASTATQSQAQEQIADCTPKVPSTSTAEDVDEMTTVLGTAAVASASASTGHVSTAEFDAILAEARDLEFVPLDDDESQESDVESEGNMRKRLLRDQSKSASLEPVPMLQDKFQCMHKSTATSKDESPNGATIAIMQQMADYYGQIGDHWRVRAYRQAISSLQRHPTKVITKEEAIALPQIGGRLAEKIEEIAVTNRLRRLDNTRDDPREHALRLFMQIYGVGLAQASRWVSASFTTLEDLVERATDLSKNHRIGIAHYEDFRSRIPRAEVAQHAAIVGNTLSSIDPAFKVIVGGSFRRGSKDSGDIDCIITRKGGDLALIRRIVCSQLVPKLKQRGFFVAELAASTSRDGSKWHGASALSSDAPWRRIDLLFVPETEIGAALIYFTGNDIFNRSMRLLARRRGLRLNQKGLFRDKNQGKGALGKLSEATLLESRDERRIFELLGVPYRPPEHRVC